MTNDPGPGLRHQPRTYQGICLREELGVGVELDLVTSGFDPGLDCVERQPPDFASQLDLTLPLRFLCFTLGTGLGPGSFHTFFVMV